VTNDVMLGSLYLLMAMMLVLGALINRREPLAKLLVMGLAWLAIFGGGFVLFTFRDDLGFIAQRLKTEATGEPMVAGSEVRIPMAIDGHFWVDGKINGAPVKFLVDSGATVTTIDRTRWCAPATASSRSHAEAPNSCRWHRLSAKTSGSTSSTATT
jgi:aspartyl protease family protein